MSKNRFFKVFEESKKIFKKFDFYNLVDKEGRTKSIDVIVDDDIYLIEVHFYHLISFFHKCDLKRITIIVKKRFCSDEFGKDFLYAFDIENTDYKSKKDEEYLKHYHKNSLICYNMLIEKNVLEKIPFLLEKQIEKEINKIKENVDNINKEKINFFKKML